MSPPPSIHQPAVRLYVSIKYETWGVGAETIFFLVTTKNKISWAPDMGVCYSITSASFPYYTSLSTIWWARGNSTLMVAIRPILKNGYRQSCVAVHCSAFQCVSVRCSALRCVAVRCSALQCVAVHCSALQCIAVHCSAMQCDAVRCSAVQCVAVCCSALQCVAVRCSVRQLWRMDIDSLDIYPRPPRLLTACLLLLPLLNRTYKHVYMSTSYISPHPHTYKLTECLPLLLLLPPHLLLLTHPLLPLRYLLFL